MPSVIYKICARADWEEACHKGAFTGSADDLRDGFIHLSSGPQVAGTLARHFAGREDLVLVAVDPGRVAASLRWEASSRGNSYPHVYGPLPVSASLGVEPLRLGPDGRHVLPEGIAEC